MLGVRVASVDTVCQNNPGDHGVAHLGRRALSMGHQLRGRIPASPFKGSDAPSRMF